MLSGCQSCEREREGQAVSTEEEEGRQAGKQATHRADRHLGVVVVLERELVAARRLDDPEPGAQRGSRAHGEG